MASAFNWHFEDFEEKVFGSKNANIVLVEKGNEEEVVGGLIFKTIPDKKVCSLEYMYVDKSYRKYGLGRHLLNQLKELMKIQSTKIEVIMLYSTNDAFEFYRKYGFLKIEVKDQSWIKVQEISDFLTCDYGCTLMLYNL